MKKLLLLFFIMQLALCSMNLLAQTKGDIAWLGNNLKADSLYFDVLKKAGYNVVDKTATKGDLTPEQIADLETFDLVILSRSLNSGDYNFPAKYNSIQAPFLCMANMAARHSRLRMFPSPNQDDPTTIQDVLAVMDLKHPIFNNIALSDSNTIDIATPGVIIKPLMNQKSAGNGKLIGVTAKDSMVLIAEWDAKQAFYPNSVDTLHGKRMVYFNTQGSNLTIAPFTSTLSDNGNQLLINIAEYMITGSVVETTKNVIFVTENVKSDSLYIDLMSQNGFSVNVVSDLLNKTPSDSALSVLEKADVIIFSRNTTSGGYQSLTQYNKLATPILLMSAYMARSNRWQVLESASAVDNETSTVKVKEPSHPIFNGMTLDPSNELALTTTAKIGTCAITTAPNATVIATSSISGNIVIAEWKKNTKFYDNNPNSAVGHRMVFFLTNTFDLTADAQTLFLNSLAYLTEFDFDTVFVNQAPTNLMLSNNAIDEELAIGTLVGALSASDPDAGTAFSYSLVAGDGTNDADNSLFVIEGASLKTSALLDFETKASYAVMIQVSDGQLTFAKSFTIQLKNLIETAVVDLEGKNLRVYPNPFDEIVFVDSRVGGNATISVYNVTGQLVYQKLHSLNNVLELKLNIPAGSYILNIRGEKMQYNKRLVRK